VDDILASARQLVPKAVSLRGGGWQTGIGVNLRNKCLGVIGLGNIGKEIAALTPSLPRMHRARLRSPHEARAMRSACRSPGAVASASSTAWSAVGHAAGIVAIVLLI
jgi:hypothetical protein